MLHKKMFVSKIAMATLLACVSLSSSANVVTEIVVHALQKNPELQARANAYEASRFEEAAARGSYKPRIDVSSSVGHEHTTYKTIPTTSYNRGGATLTISQILFDGGQRDTEVRKSNMNATVKYYELRNASNDVGLEAVRAAMDIERFRTLVKLAQENYVQHKVLFEQISRRAETGIGRKVDVTQAQGRLALAESNLITEVANLHDVMARFQRVVGLDIPATSWASVSEWNAIPQPNEGWKTALENSPTIQVALAVLNTSKFQLKSTTQNNAPKIEARLRTGVGSNYDASINRQSGTTIEVLASWNLYNGGIDQAHINQYSKLMASAENMRDKSCDEVRQTYTIAINDINKLTAQLQHLKTHRDTMMSTRDVYKKQFEVGQRSLLDVLNTENEVFMAQRSYVMGQLDLEFSKARLQHSMGTLLSSLGLAPTPNVNDEGINKQLYLDYAASCQYAPMPVKDIDREALDARVNAQLKAKATDAQNNLKSLESSN